jgi:hypothetical protein
VNQIAAAALACLVALSLTGQAHALYGCSTDADCNYDGCCKVACSSWSPYCNNGVWDYSCVDWGGPVICSYRPLAWFKYDPGPDGNCKICGHNEEVHYFHSNGNKYCYWEWRPDRPFCPEPDRCAAGEYSSDGRDRDGNKACSKCPAGTYSPTAGATECTFCPAGKHSNETDATECTFCPAGKHSNETGASSCARSLCAAGKYGQEVAKSSAAAECTDCAAGKYVTATAATSCTDCGYCPTGQVRNGCGSSPGV